jgi:hypothetical protein
MANRTLSFGQNSGSGTEMPFAASQKKRLRPSGLYGDRVFDSLIFYFQWWLENLWFVFFAYNDTVKKKVKLRLKG